MLNLLLLGLVLEVLVIVALLAAIFHRLAQQRERLAQARRRHGAFLGDGATFEVALLRDAELGRSALALRKAPCGVLAIRADGVRYAAVTPAGEQTIEFDPASRMTLFAPPWFGLGVPPLVRLRAARETFFLFVRGRLSQPDPAKTRALAQALSTRLRNDPDAEAAGAASPRAIVLVALLTAGTVAAAFAGYARPQHGGIWALAANATGAVAATPQEILRFDADGKLVAQAPFAQFGLPHAPAALALAPDGELYAGDAIAGRIYRCGPPSAPACVPLAQPLPEAQRPHGAFKLAFDAAGTHLVVSVADRDTLLVLDRDGRVLSMLEPPESTLCFPNGLAFGADGHLYVADSNRFRIAEFAFDGDALRYLGEHATAASAPATAGRECRGAHLRRYLPLGAARALPGARAGRVWPVALAQAGDGAWWVTLASDQLDDADVAEFAPDWRAPHVERLGAHAELTTLAAHADAVWAADTRLGVERLRHGAAPEPLSEPGFAAYLRQVEDDRRRVFLRRLVGLGGTAVLLLLAVIGASLATRAHLARLTGTAPRSG